MIRAFVAIELDEALRGALAVQQFQLPLPSRVPVENLHLTLAFLGETPERDLEAAHEGLGALRLEGFQLGVSGIGLFGGSRPRAVYAAVLPSAPLMRLQGKVETVVRRAGIEVEARKFLPHVTLCRFRPPGAEVAMRLERAVVDQAVFRPASMEVRGFALFRSYPVARGSRYEKLADYALAVPGP